MYDLNIILIDEDGFEKIYEPTNIEYRKSDGKYKIKLSIRNIDFNFNVKKIVITQYNKIIFIHKRELNIHINDNLDLVLGAYYPINKGDL